MCFIIFKYGGLNEKIFIIVLGLIVVLSAFGIFDTMQKNKKAEELASKTIVFFGEIENIEEVDGKAKFTITGAAGSPEEFVGKKYSFVETDKTKVVDSEEEKNLK